MLSYQHELPYKKKTNKRTLNKPLHLTNSSNDYATWKGITGAMRMAPTAAMKVLLGLPPLHLQLEAEARIGNYRLHCNGQWKPKSEGFEQAYMTWDIETEPTLQMGTDKMVPRNVYVKSFTIRLPDRREWKKGF
jgi:hypothetical protein